jgi:hypothetical protein
VAAPSRDRRHVLGGFQAWGQARLESAEE